ncbi:SidA/IucD/PvdA family monooxygenase [Pseudoxanthomonas sp. LjRoot168]|uniref:SidA/IucD/PvdA family monooxygenase n=1 Tax=unclassified Pseudoxanthomonas TaxID=2645906 RepID=UPI003ED0F781
MTGSREVRLAIIGGGPKAVAIAAKASVLNRTRFGGVAPVSFEVVVFERDQIGANWSGGKAGYTDGDQQLCTLIERDLGFPYTSGLAYRIEALAKQDLPSESIANAQLSVDGQSVDIDDDDLSRTGSLIDAELQARFSWSAFLTSHGRYREWVDSGRKPPEHREFARYLYWAFERTDAHLLKATVTGLGVGGGKWEVKAKSKNGRTIELDEFDGVIATGPGPVKSKLIRPSSHRRIFDGIDFWKRRGEIKKALDKPGATVAILGGGGTGAAMLAWLARNGYSETVVTLVTDQATIYTRTDNWFESRLFGDASLWQALSDKSKRDFFDRVNRGVVWNNVVADLEKLKGLQVVDGRATQIEVLKDELQILVPDAVKSNIVRASIAVDATGFDPWYFADWLPAGAGMPTTLKSKQAMKSRMTEHLDWRGGRWRFPPLHAPMLADKWGPGLGSLMSLGAMSDRVLGRYLT